MSDCHRRIEMFMRTLSAAAKFEGRRLSDEERRDLEAALRYFREAAPKHNADEEESLFPRLRSLPDLEVQRVLINLDRLEQEHRWAAPLHMEIDRLGQQWLSNDDLEKMRSVPSRLPSENWWICTALIFILKSLRCFPWQLGFFRQLRPLILV
jgi:hypothetical protein